MKKLILSSIAMFLPALAFADATGTGTIVGGDRDTHGCIGSAGYSWDATITTCARPWEQRPTGTGQAYMPMRPLQDAIGTMGRPPRDASGSMDRPPRDASGSMDRPPRDASGSMDRPPRDDSGSMDRPPRDDSGSMAPPPPKDNFGIDTNVIETAMQNLSETDKEDLAKMIQTFLESKGIKLPKTEEIQTKKQEIKKEIQQTRQMIQSARKNIKQARQNLRERKSPPPKNETSSGTIAQ